MRYMCTERKFSWTRQQSTPEKILKLATYIRSYTKQPGYAYMFHFDCLIKVLKIGFPIKVTMVGPRTQNPELHPLLIPNHNLADCIRSRAPPIFTIPIDPYSHNPNQLLITKGRVY